MNIAIVGSRNYPDLGRVAAYVAAIARKYPDAKIISGGAKGVDTTAEEAARQAGLGVYSYRPERAAVGYRIRCLGCLNSHWLHDELVDGPTHDSFGRAAFARNRNIVEHADIVVAFTTGSRGTANSIAIAQELGKRTFIYGGQQ